MPAVGSLESARSATRASAASIGHLLPELLYVHHQAVDLLLLSIDHKIEFFEQVFGVAGLDFEFGQAGFDGDSGIGSGIGSCIGRAHPGIGTDLA